jgi:two-component system LytT family response regulator
MMERANKKIRTLIVDDEPLARQNLHVLLKDDPEIEIIGECGSGHEALRVIQAKPPDLLFLDIQMPEMNGFDVLKRIDRERLPAIIFVTAFDQYALKAFEVHALDYLLKPFNDERFEKALRQAKSQLEQREINNLSRKLFALLEDRQDVSQADKPEQTALLTRVMIKSTSRVFFLKVDEIDWIEADDYYVKLHTGRKSHLLRETMGELEAKLDAGKFLRIHRSTIVNIDRIKELSPLFNGDYAVILQDGTELKLSRSRREHAQAVLQGGRL